VRPPLAEGSDEDEDEKEETEVEVVEVEELGSASGVSMGCSKEGAVRDIEVDIDPVGVGRMRSREEAVVVVETTSLSAVVEFCKHEKCNRKVRVIPSDVTLSYFGTHRSPYTLNSLNLAFLPPPQAPMSPSTSSIKHLDLLPTLINPAGRIRMVT
jgi:hypothetical protein